MTYILGHRPYEFGLVPDREGFVTRKDLLRAIHEEPGWGYVREGAINEVLLSGDRMLFQAEDKRIRAMDRRWILDLRHPSPSIPKILFTGIRRKAHPSVMKNGLRRVENGYHVLSPERKMAGRIGRRRDQKPVIVEIAALMAQRDGILFYSFGELFLASSIPKKYIVGPPLPKDVIKTMEEKSRKKQEPPPDFLAGTFTLDPDRDMDQSRRTRGRKRKGWKEEARRYRKNRRSRTSGAGDLPEEAD